jgi:uncharacterized RDD family membrane protein YckC
MQTAACSQCQEVHPLSDLLNYAGSYVCAGCKPLFFQRLQEGQVLGQLVYAGFWIRFVAYIIDAVVLNILQMPLWFVSGRNPFEQPDPALVLSDPWGYWAPSLLVVALSFPLTIAYHALFVGRFGGTPGKLALSLRVVKPDGSKLSYQHAVGRAFAEILTGFTCLIGYIIAGFDQQKRALHDHVAGTRVIKIQ